jgi:hypothetical protein
MKDVTKELEVVERIRAQIQFNKGKIEQNRIKLREVLSPLEDQIRELRQKYSKQDSEPERNIQEHEDEIRGIYASITNQLAAFAQEAEYRTKDGIQITIVRRELISVPENKNGLAVKYYIKKSGNSIRNHYSTYNYYEADIQKFITTGEWEPATKNTFKLRSGIIFNHVVKIKAPDDVVKDDRVTYYIGLTYRGNGIIFSVRNTISTPLPNPGTPADKWKVNTRGRDYVTISIIPTKGTKVSRWNRMIDKYARVYRVVDKKQAKEILMDYLI